MAKDGAPISARRKALTPHHKSLIAAYQDQVIKQLLARPVVDLALARRIIFARRGLYRKET